jgi:uncharacterized RDD family membrane protein YckC
VIRICSKCGALLLKGTAGCSFCDLPPDEDNETFVSLAAEPVERRDGAIAARAETAEAEPEWRVEVSRRLEQYRVRRGRVHPEELQDEFQANLPFRKSVRKAAIEQEEAAPRAPVWPVQRPTQRPRQPERVEIRIQPELDFSSAGTSRAHPQTALVPVATLAERRWAGVLDMLFLAVTCAGFLALFRSLGGQITLEKMDAVVYVAVAYLFYSLYLSLFTTLAGATPGMQLRCLTIVRLDGSLPDTCQLLWRSFGYVLSGATLMLGYVWALWDEDRFTWHDRISQTYITAAAPVSGFDSFDMSVGAHTFAHKSLP